MDVGSLGEVMSKTLEYNNGNLLNKCVKNDENRTIAEYVLRDM